MLLVGPTGASLIFWSDVGGTVGTVGEYDATTGAAINTSFLMGVSRPEGLAILGDRLLVAIDGIPALATNGNVPTSSTPNFLTGLNGPTFLAIGNVPEPSTWALLAVGTGALGLALRRRAARFFPGRSERACGRSPL